MMQRPVLMVHGGAGRDQPDVADEQRRAIAHAVRAGWEVLAAGGPALEAVTAAVAILEDHPLFNAGVGSCLTENGTVEMDASIMDGTRLRAGAVGAVTTVVNPVRLARAVLEDGRHMLLVGAGAERFARARAVPTAPPASFVTARQRERAIKRSATDPGTVGAVAVDRRSRVAAATSTGGVARKLPGRVGDSAIIGAGTYADDAAGAASATGFGEAIIIAGLAKAAVDLLRNGMTPAVIAAHVVDVLTKRLGADAGIILVDRFGRLAHARNTERMLVGYRGNGLEDAVVEG